MVYTTKSGKKLYPVCSWEQNQHKLYNALDRINNAIYDAEEGDANADEWNKLLDRKAEIEDALSAFDSHVIDGIVYATWEMGQKIKDIVWAYNARH